MRDIHVMEILSKMMENANYSKLMCRYYMFKETFK